MYYNPSPYHSIIFFCVCTTFSVGLFMLFMLFVQWFNSRTDKAAEPDVKSPKLNAKELFDLLSLHQQELSGKVWRHESSGNLYWVTSCCLNASTRKVHAVYLRFCESIMPVSDLTADNRFEFYNLFSRDVEEFKRKFTCVGLMTGSTFSKRVTL